MSLGIIKLKVGEAEGVIAIPLLNDPSGENKKFTVKLAGVEGRDKLSDKTNCDVTVTNLTGKCNIKMIRFFEWFHCFQFCFISVLVLPNGVTDIEGHLSDVDSVVLSWKPPVGGGPVDGYKVVYGNKPDEMKTIELPADVSPNTHT